VINISKDLALLVSDDYDGAIYPTSYGSLVLPLR
jgi:hypothetical protein